MPKTLWRVDGQKLYQCRRRRGLTLEELSTLTEKFLEEGVQARTIQRYEDGDPCVPRKIRAVAAALQKDVEKLLTPDSLARTRNYYPTFITGANEEEFSLLYKSFECYTKIFPDERERNDPEDMERWIHKRRNAERTNDPWRDVYAVLHAGEDVIGMAYLFVRLCHPWAFGAYFGITSDDRILSRADKFLEAIVERVQITNPKVKAIIFEIDPIDFNILGEALSDLSCINVDEQLLSTLKAIRRFRFFQQSCLARVVLGLDGHPFPYWEPSWDDHITEETEGIEKILMVKSLEGHRITNSEIPDILNFIFDVVYDYADKDDDPDDILEWASHVSKLKSRVLERIGDANINRLRLPKETYRLLSRVKGQVDL